MIKALDHLKYHLDIKQMVFDNVPYFMDEKQIMVNIEEIDKYYIYVNIYFHIGTPDKHLLRIWFTKWDCEFSIEVELKNKIESINDYIHTYLKEGLNG